MQINMESGLRRPALLSSGQCFLWSIQKTAELKRFIYFFILLELLACMEIYIFNVFVLPFSFVLLLKTTQELKKTSRHLLAIHSLFVFFRCLENEPYQKRLDC